MRNYIVSLLRLAVISLAAIPALASAVVPASLVGTPYDTDQANSYVQDQTSQVMKSLNNILCFMGAMAPNLMVNAGNYIALVDKNTCDSGGGSGGKSNNKGQAFTSVVVNSTRATTVDPMLVNAWLEFPEDNQSIKVHASATQAPSTTLPYGLFRMDFCGYQTGVSTTCQAQGFINATSSGLSFLDEGTYGTSFNNTALQLSATTPTTGSGVVKESNNWTGATVNTTFAFAYNGQYFIRDDGSSSTCFNRDATVADESVWRYGLYDSSTGAQVTRNSGFPVEYTDGTGTYNGYMSYYGMWMPVTVPNGATVKKVSYGPSGATKTDFTLFTTGGKLMKFTSVAKTLADLDKITFWYFANQNVGTGPIMTAFTQYELYWDNTAGTFKVSGKQGTTGNMEPYATHVTVPNADMLAANSWGLFGWSQMMGGQFGIKGTDFAALTGGTPSTIAVITQTQDVVYPTDYATSLPNGLVCINDCPTAALIASSNAGTGTAYSNPGWTPVTTFVNYTLSSTTGNLVDAAATDVVSTATTGTNSWGVRSGRMVTPAGRDAIITAKEASGLCGTTGTGACNTAGFNQGDVDFLPTGSSYYVWETGANPWNQIAILKDTAGAAVVFDAPLQVSFTVPTGAQYGNFAGATMSLQYGGFGDLWGIPNECIDITTNTACDFATTLPENQRWASLFSIPFDATTGKVTAGTTTYLVKALDKEVRLKKELLSVCTAAGLTAPAVSSVTLPTAADWLDPSSIGAKPTFTSVPAPAVIHGVKK